MTTKALGSRAAWPPVPAPLAPLAAWVPPCLLVLAAAALARPAGAAAPQRSALEDSFGFVDHEIYELANGVAALRAGDFDGNGVNDLVVVNPARSRIELLLRLDPDAPDWVDEAERTDDPNPIEYDGRFRNVRRPEERRILHLDAGDFDGDGAADLAYVTDTAELVVVTGLGEGAPERVHTRRLDALRSGCDYLRAADADDDGTDDLLIVADGKLLWVAPRGGGEWSEPVVLDRMESGVDRIHVADLDGDGRSDLLYVFDAEEYPLRLRLGVEGGGFGPRTEPDLPELRTSHVVDLDGDGRAEILGVYQASGRLAALQLEVTAAGGARPDARRALARYPFPEREDSEQETGFALGDLDGNGVTDLVVSDPGAARVSLFLGERGERALSGVDFPSLVGVRDPRIGDVDGDGASELVVVSEPERMIGVARLEGGRLPFPRTVAVEGEPAAMDVADVNGDGVDDVVVVATTGEGRRREYFLHVHVGTPEGLSAEPATHAIDGLERVPNAIRVADLDRDGEADVVAFLPDGRSVPVLLVQRDGAFVSDARGEDTPGLGILKGAGPRAMAYGDSDGDGASELVVCANNFARALYFEADDDGSLHPHVLEQFNGPASDSSIQSCAVFDLDGDGRPEVVLFDARSGELLVLERGEGGETRLRERIEAGRMQVVELGSSDMDGDGQRDLVSLATDQVGVLYADRRDVAIREASFHEPKHARIFLHGLTSGDLNADGVPDVVASELTENAILILAAGDDGLEHGLGFKVFDEKTFSNRGRSPEPREMVAADLTGDGKADLALLVHDKLVLYVQE